MVQSLEKTLSQADYEALATLRYTLRKFTDFSTSAAHEAGLPPQQHQALLAIKGSRPGETMTIGMLAERLLIAPHTATELVGRLIDAGYATRNTDPADKRRQTLQLTQKSEDVLHRLSAIHLVEIRDMAPKLIEILTRLQADVGRE
ncbi:helix-turn-helix domain-containing protein [Rhizobium sp. SG570]|jgi:DNA-binding MarR family transcriptional regulator|uniref:MarR family winged helix-turn-helix transcriptional regulator n=1 Tax=Rhizobium sp. SG570 TaxID=2587113 RepID=UPI0014488C9A|nr:helix-turn-helix domain-containing protein [Rhizobium sp. SG570]NKJ33586.1 DNA-binding MarR family transcriptional regulator [Rhizobium sp. SG570]